VNTVAVLPPLAGIRPAVYDSWLLEDIGRATLQGLLAAEVRVGKARGHLKLQASLLACRLQECFSFKNVSIRLLLPLEGEMGVIRAGGSAAHGSGSMHFTGENRAAFEPSCV